MAVGTGRAAQPIGSEAAVGRAGDISPRWGPFVIPAVIVSALLFVLPIGVFALNSVLELVAPGRPGRRVTLENYATVLGDPFYWRAFVVTVELAAAVVVGTLVLGYPLAYVLARSRSRWRTIVAGLVVVSLFVSVVIRAIGWKVILGPNGPINVVLRGSGLISTSLPLTENFLGTVIGLTHALLPFMVLILVPVIQLVPRSLEDAALSLGAPWWRVFWRVILPLTAPGVISGSLMVASMAMGAFTTPALLSGGRVPFVPLLIEQQVLLLLNYPLGAALAAILVATVFCINGVTFRVFRSRFYQAPL